MKLFFGLLIIAVLIFLKSTRPPESPIPPAELPLQATRSTDSWPQKAAVNDTENIANIENIESELSRFSGLDFAQFSDVQLAQYNSLIMKKAELLKIRIFEKYFLKYGRGEI